MLQGVFDESTFSQLVSNASNNPEFRKQILAIYKASSPTRFAALKRKAEHLKNVQMPFKFRSPITRVSKQATVHSL